MIRRYAVLLAALLLAPQFAGAHSVNRSSRNSGKSATPAAARAALPALPELMSVADEAPTGDVPLPAAAPEPVSFEAQLAAIYAALPKHPLSDGFEITAEPTGVTPFAALAAESLAPEASGRVIFSDGGTFLVKKDGVNEADFNDLYVLRTDLEAEVLAAYGKILHHEQGRFAVAKVAPGFEMPLARLLHSRSNACGSMIRLTGEAQELATAAPVPVTPIESVLPAVQQAAAKVEAANIKATVTDLSALHTRYHESETGKGVAAMLAQRYQTLAKSRSDVSVSVFEHGSRTPQPSLVVRIEGRTRPDEIIVLGSHIDSINQNDTDQRAPGADDNASGTSTNLEIFRVMMEQGLQLDRTLEIHGYSAEEIGLVGSLDIAAKYVKAGRKVKAMVQIDMNLYTEGADEIWFVSNDTDKGFNEALGKLVDQYVKIPHAQAPLWAGTSDHYSWTKKGIPSAFPFENPRRHNPNIHTPKDTLEGMSFTQAAAFAKLGLAYVAHYGGIVAPPKVEEKKEAKADVAAPAAPAAPEAPSAPAL